MPGAVQRLRPWVTALRLLIAAGATALFLPNAQAATWVVTNSIASTLEAARNGDTVLVPGPTVYRERVVINKSIRLIGTNNPVLDADNAGSAITIAAPRVTVQGIHIRNTGRDLTTFDSGILIQAEHTAVRECIIETDGFGVYVRGAAACVISSNVIQGNPGVAAAARGNVIHLWKTTGNEIASNQIRHKRDGIYLSYADDNVIAGNRISDTRFGIHYMYSHRNQLLTNRLSGNAVGATLMFSRGSLVDANVAFANRRHGMVLKQLENSKVTRNIVAGQNRGFFVQQASQNRFENNLIATNDIGLYLTGGSEGNLFVGNAFVRNVDQVWQPPFETGQGRQSRNAFSENGRGNFWSDYVGQDRNHDGIGDTPYRETDVFGYIVDRHPNARVLAMSPALALLRKGEERMPLVDVAGVTDLAPLMAPGNPKSTSDAR